MRSWVWPVRWIVAAVTLLLLDAVWLSTVASDFYDDRLGALKNPEPNLGAAAVFYAVFVCAVLFFVVGPALARGSWRYALGAGAFFGLICYMTWDLTNLAVIEGFPAAIVPVDLAWGTGLTAVVSLVTYAVSRRWVH